MRLELHWRSENGTRLPVALWCPGPGCVMISSGVVGGGIGPRAWVLNAQVPAVYSRTDTAAHVAELAAGFGLSGQGVGMLTAAQVTKVVQREDEGVHVAATVGLSVPTWAAPAGPAGAGPDPGSRPGTINIIVSVPVPLSDAAYVNAVITGTEAKTQAILDAGFRGTGTATDAICVAAPADGTHEEFTGPRSPWGGRVARAVYAAVRAGAARFAGQADVHLGETGRSR